MECSCTEGVQISPIKPEVLRRGKTKTVFATPSFDQVSLRSRDVIGDGNKVAFIKSKGKHNNAIAVNCLRLLAKKGIETHFIATENETAFLAERANPIPLEVVVRRRAAGSYLLRNPNAHLGDVFSTLVVEFYLKDDARNDPFIEFDFEGERVLLYDSKKSLRTGHIGFLPFDILSGDAESIDENLIEEIRHRALQIFLVLEQAWERVGVTLVDLKLEFGFSIKTHRLLLIDAIDNDSWRIWLGGDPRKAKDKQIFRDLEVVSPTDLICISEIYAWVADQSNRFAENGSTMDL